MSRFISNIATLLLAPLILSATCLLCFVQVAPVSAASISETQGEVCSEGQTSTQTFTTQTISINNPMAFATGVNMVSETDHDSGCKGMMDHPGTRVNSKDVSQNADHSVLFVVAETNHQFHDQKYPFTFFKKTVLIRDDFLTGTLIKRE